MSVASQQFNVAPAPSGMAFLLSERSTLHTNANEVTTPSSHGIRFSYPTPTPSPASASTRTPWQQRIHHLSSLDILLNPAPHPTPNQSPHVDEPTVVPELERRARRISEIMNARDWTHPDLHRWIPPDFRATGLSCANRITSRAQYLDVYRHFTHEYPDWRLDCLNVSSDVDEVRGHAKIWILVRIRGGGGGGGGRAGATQQVRENVTVMSWRKTPDGRDWVWYHALGTPGIVQQQ